MIHFVTSRQSYERLVASSAWPPVALWLTVDVLDSFELAALRRQGLTVTDFTSHFDVSNAVEMADALDTIREHHPGHAGSMDGSVVT
ncbi:hypothetical protein FHW73_000464 [Luteimonas sp. RC10]|nr:hypothetical protein [Luteimonas sp. RC10]